MDGFQRRIGSEEPKNKCTCSLCFFLLSTNIQLRRKYKISTRNQHNSGLMRKIHMTLYFYLTKNKKGIFKSHLKLYVSPLSFCLYVSVCQKQNIQLLGCIKTTLSYPSCLQMLTHQPNPQLSGIRCGKDLSEVTQVQPLRDAIIPWRLLFLVSIKSTRKGKNRKLQPLPMLKYSLRRDS